MFGHRLLVFSYQDTFQNDLQTKCQKVTKTFSSVYISVDSPEQDIIVFNFLVRIKLMLRD